MRPIDQFDAAPSYNRMPQFENLRTFVIGLIGAKFILVSFYGTKTGLDAQINGAAAP